MPTKTATLTSTNTPIPTITPTPTPKIYTLRLVFSTTSDWSNLSFFSRSILDARLVDKKGNLTSFWVNKTFLGVEQTLANAQALKEVSITVDFDISSDTTNKFIPFLLQKGSINSSDIRFYNVLKGTTYSLLDEVYRNGYVNGHEDVNPYNFSFDLEPLFQDVAAIATLTQPKAGTGKFIFEYYKVAYEKIFPDLKGERNVFTSNWDGTDLTPVTNGLKGFNRIESISPDGKIVLISSRSSYAAKGELYLIHLDFPESDPIKLARGVETSSRQAIFLDNTRIVYIGQGPQGYGFYIVNIDGTNPKRIGAPTGRLWWIVSSDKTRVYWESVRKENFRDSYGSLYMYGDFGGLWWTNIDGSGQGKLESNGQQIIGNYAFSRDGKLLAWIPKQTEPDCMFTPFYTKWITDGTYTRLAAKSPSNPWHGQTIDMAWVKAYVRRCWIMYVALLSELDNPTRIVLMPPANLIKGDFTFSKDGTLLVGNQMGQCCCFLQVRWIVEIANHEPLLYYVNLMDTEPKLVEYRHSLFSRSDATYMLDFSPDGQQILVANRAGGPYIRILDLNTLTFSDLFGNNLTPDSDVGRIGSIYWLP
jgi:hypothetical protein